MYTIILASFIIIASCFVLPVYDVKIKQFSLIQPYSDVLLYLSALLFVILLSSQVGIKHLYALPSLTDVYNQRSIFKETMGLYTGDIVRIFMYSIFPFSLAKGLNDSKIRLISVGVIGQIIIYSVGGFRSPLAIIIGVAGLYFLMQRLKMLNAVSIGIVFIVITGTAYISEVLFGATMIKGLLFGRLLFAPGLASTVYFDFFTTAERAPDTFFPYFWWLFESTYTTPVPAIVGQEYVPGSYLNGSYISNGFATFGYLGVILYSFMISFSFWVYDVAANNRNMIPYICIPGVIIAITNTSPAAWLNFTVIIAPAQVIFSGASTLRMFTYGSFIILIILNFLLVSKQ